MNPADTPTATSTPPRHAAPALPCSPTGELLVSGVPASKLTAQCGTPLYAISRQAVAERVALLRSVLPAGIRLHYAIKANPMPALVDCLAKQIDGFDVASERELALAIAAGHGGLDIGFAGPAKRDPELRAAAACGAVVQVESAGELARLAGIARAEQLPARAAVRINPDFELRQSSVRMGGGPQAFGVDAEQVPALLRAWPQGVEFIGFHIYAGSQNLNATHIASALQQSYALCRQLAADAPSAPQVFNLGGGFGIPYFAGETRLDLTPIGAALATIQQQAVRDFPGLRLVLELGRYLVGEAGVFLTRVIDKKVSRGQIYLLCDGGMHQHLAASGNFGQVLRRNFPIWLATAVNAAPSVSANICGPLCTPLDILGQGVELPAVEVGDLIAIGQSGAYGASASPAGFLSHPPAHEVLV